MSGRKRLILADITQGKARGKALIAELGQMNQAGGSYEKITPKKSKKK